uniref:Heat shock protein 15 n=1 Tax=Magnetococcus massalia (strain MO-1) TaxID=451514 RepID=A0A1S7LPK8_MAGMO|nr:Heat shock protein 15 [Candidatus Magnetococcus massalia]
MSVPVFQGESVRIDKWLWAARFFKTRSMAAEAVNGGKVHVNGQRVKPSKAIRRDDRLEILRGHDAYEVTVLALAEKRGSAKIAATLYQESDASMAERERVALQRKLAHESTPDPGHGRPTKRDRRQMEKLRF